MLSVLSQITLQVYLRPLQAISHTSLLVISVLYQDTLTYLKQVTVRTPALTTLHTRHMVNDDQHISNYGCTESL